MRLRLLALAMPFAIVLMLARISLADEKATPVPPPTIDLRQLLNKGLLARRPSEFAFIDRVVFLVDEGTLPLPLVQSSFLWARKKPRFPAFYFERAVRLRASKLGIEIDE